jgi:hypothetical protein
MSKLTYILPLLIFTFFSNAVSAQAVPQGIVVYPKGIVTGKIEKKGTGKNITYLSLPDTISLEDVKSMTAINVIDFDNKNILVLNLISYKLRIDDNGVQMEFETTEPVFNEDIKSRFAALNSGSILYFEEIRVLYPNKTFAHGLPLTLVVR